MKPAKLILLMMGITIGIARAQVLHYSPNEQPIRPQMLSDEDQIRNMLSELVSAIRNGQVIRAIRPFSEEINLPVRAKGNTNGLFPLLFQIDSVSIQISNGRAFVRCQLNDKGALRGTNELLTLKRANGFWRIDGAGILVDLIADHFFTKKKVRRTHDTPKSFDRGHSHPDRRPVETVAAGAVSVRTVASPSIVMSNRALIRRLVPYTDVWSITRTTTQQNLQRSLFSAPSDGEVFMPHGTNDYMALILDRAWFRLVYGSLNGRWIKSYGDNQGDYRFQTPIAIDADALGNIYCVNALTRTIVKLQYNSSSQAVSYVSEIPVVGLMNPVDLDIDNNNSPSDPNDDTFWVADNGANALLQVAPTGQVVGRATRVIDTYTGTILDLSSPTKVLVFFDYARNVSFIDRNKKRVITIYGPTFQSGSISGYVTSAEFDSQSNVQLESLGIDYTFGHPLYAVDKTNGMLHLFDVANYIGGGYLASIKELTDGQAQWAAPLAAASIATSGSLTNTLDVLTLDTWGDTRGINAYLPGADFLNPYTESADYTAIDPTWWGTVVGAILPTACKMKVDLYRSDGSFIKTKSDGSWTTPASRSGVFVIANDVGNPIGLYRARFEITPSQNGLYDQYQQPAIVRDVWFSMPLKLSGISGPSTVYHTCCKGQPANSYTWTVNVTSGAPSSYIWFKNGSQVGMGPSYTEYFSWNGYNGGSYQFTLRVDVRDAQNSLVSASKVVTANNSGGGVEVSIGEMKPEEPIPSEYSITQNFPNPFNPETEILFGLPEPSHVRITITDILGRKVTTLVEGYYSHGYKRARWNGLDDSGKRVSSGVYFYQIAAKGDSGREFSKVVKMVVTK